MTRAAESWICATLACLLGLRLLLFLETFPFIRRSVFLKRLRYRFFGNAIQGYKGFRADMTCKGMQYRENGEFIQSESPKLCSRGFHFCQRLTDVFDHYDEATDVYCPVTAFGSVAGPCDSDKQCTDAIRIGRRLTPPEIYAVLLQENPLLPKDHRTIDLVYTMLSERGCFHRRLDLVLKWLKRAENYTARLARERKGDGSGREARRGVVRVGGRLRKR